MKDQYRVESKAKHDPIWFFIREVETPDEALQLKVSAESIRRETNPRTARILKRDASGDTWTVWEEAEGVAR